MDYGPGQESDYEEADGWEDASGDDVSLEGDEEGIENPEDSEGSEYQAFETNFAEPVESGSGRDVEADVNAEKAIEGDFRRLVENIKEGKSQGLGTSSSIWDVSIEEAEGFDMQEELKTATGIGRRRKSRRGPRDQPQLSQQVKALLGEGNAAYVSQNLPEAVRLMEEVIRIEPRVPSAWATLALCYQDEQPEKALKLKIVRAHLVHDVDLWSNLGNESRDRGYLQQALYCYRKACTLDPTDVNAQWDRASLSKELGDYRTAKAAFTAILKQYPHDISALEEIRPILVELSEIPRGIELYQGAFEFYQERYSSGVAQDATGNDIPGGGFGDIHIIVLADFYNSINDPEKAITTIRRGARWLQGRAEERFWDNEPDDREFDLPNFIRRVQENQMAITRYPLDINFRHRLAVSRLMLGDYEEGKLHSDIILQNDVREHAVLFNELADTMFDQGLFDAALGIYEVLSADEMTSSFRIVFQAAACHRNIGNLKEGAEIYQHILTGDSQNIDAKMKLAEVYEAMGEPRKALNLVYEVIDSRRRAATRDGTSDRAPSANTQPGDSLFEEKTPRGKPKRQKRGMTIAQLQALELEHEAATVQRFEKLRELAPAMKDGDETAEAAWLAEAEKLVESFREVKPLFPSTRIEFRGMPLWRKGGRKSKAEQEGEEQNMASRLQLEIEYDKVASKNKKNSDEKATEFRRISFDQWLLLFVEYAFLLTKRDQYPLAEEVLRHAMQSVVFQEPHPADSLRMALIACAIRTKQYETVVSMARKLINVHQFNNGPPRLLLASLASGLLSVDAFIDSRLQKHLNREVKLSDAVAKGQEVRWNSHNRRYNLVGAAAEKDDPEEQEEVAGESSALPIKPTKYNPVMVCIYGQLCIAAKSYQSGIFYLLHAYEYQPNDPVICLSLAIAYMGRAMQRQTDNRHFMIAESLAFMSRYRDIRSRDKNNNDNIDEIEYNFGRAFHQIGLFHYAKKHYEQVLSNTENRRKENTNYVGLSREAAYNLSLIYMATGATGLAKALYRQWLSI